jgi:paraquat-inducible protein B
MPAALSLDTQSLASSCWAAWRSPTRPTPPRRPPAADGQRFELFPTARPPLAPPDGPPLRVRMVFDQAQRGLVAGAPVDMLGIEIGSVRSVSLIDAPNSDQFPVEVIADLIRCGWVLCGASSSRPPTAPTARTRCS